MPFSVCQADFVILQSPWEIPQGEEFAGLEPCALKVQGEDHQRDHCFPPESRWIVLALFNFPSGLYFGSILWGRPA